MQTASRYLTELIPLLNQMGSLSSSVLRSDPEAIRKITELCNQVTAEKIEYLPTLADCRRCHFPILVADVMKREGIAANLFGFRKAGDRLTLHDHPKMRGFLKCIRGSMRIRSFTQLEDVSKKEVKCRYEGEQTNFEDSGVIQLSPHHGDIHEIEALEDGSFFFDVLFPGYDQIYQPCTYFTEEEEETAVHAGSISILRKLKGPPMSQQMSSFYFPKF